jgi:hypothetical protein
MPWLSALRDEGSQLQVAIAQRGFGIFPPGQLSLILSYIKDLFGRSSSVQTGSTSSQQETTKPSGGGML